MQAIAYGRVDQPPRILCRMDPLAATFLIFRASRLGS